MISARKVVTGVLFAVLLCAPPSFAQAPADPVIAPSDAALNAQSPATTPSASVPAAGRAPTRARPALDTDEAGLWGMADRAELSAQASGERNRDPELNAYVQQVACRVANELCGDIRLYIFERPAFNATMAPNGYMEVWSGLLLRAEDEAQLAFVLGHEVSHYDRVHSLASWRTLRGRATGAFMFSMITGAAGIGILGDIAYLGTLASVYGYSRENETEADTLGFQRAVAAGYDPNAGAAIWSALIAETAASDIEDVRTREASNSIFRTHPLSADRIANLEAQAARHEGAGATERVRYRAAIRPHLSPWLRAELRRRDFGQTLHLLDRLAAHSEDLGVISYYRGETLRIRRGEGDLAAARTHYQAAISYPDAPPEAWRELADLCERAGEHAQAAELLAIYLSRAPNSADRALVQARHDRLAGGQ